MRKGRMITVTMIAVLLGSSAYVFRTRAKQDEAYANVTVAFEYPGDDRRVLISAPGVTEPQSGTIEIVSEVTGVLLEVHVAAGDIVSKGQILAELANDIQSAHVDLAQATLEKSQAELARLRNGDRPEEQAVLEAQYEAALASHRLARFEWQQIEDMTERAVAALRAGVDGDTIARASASLGEELEALRRHRRQTEAWTLDSRNESDRVRQLWELADIAHLRLSSMSEQEKAAVLDLLDVRVRVLDHGKRLIPPRITIEGTVFYELLTEQMSGDLVSAGPPVLAPLRR